MARKRRPCRCSSRLSEPACWPSSTGYDDQCRHSDAVIARTPLSAPPQGRHPEPMGDELADLRGIIMHVIEETARHAGHLDIARELLDGRTGLGPR
ncbi:MULTISPECIES: DUF664 domain-containing protein [unclassified Streptomyces]|uniref:mycothiol transferase n=1 Tax=unclassified Streptomyces TaxID=2593676 RepID=UPI002E196235|nr:MULTISPECIES: DUF664 domain-containing protein [unclassified Streptomyces]